MASHTVPVTLNCSGGIALGAYMAGVFSELVKASLRSGPDGSGEVLRIDSITGASAGAMTGLIAARYLLQDPERSLAELLDDQVAAAAPRNGFYRAWVRLADIQALTDYGAEEQVLEAQVREGIPPRPRLGLLSSGSIAAIADQVGGDWKQGDLAGMRRALERRSLALVMTATNLQGVLRIGDGGLRSLSHAETRRFLFHRAMPDLAAGDLSALNRRWAKAKDSARASGAFPLAFPPLSNDSHPRSINLNFNDKTEALYRQEASRPDPRVPSTDPDRVCWLEAPGGTPAPQPSQLRLRFDYTDGGVLDGLPIVKGIGLLNQLGSLDPGSAPMPPCRKPGPDEELKTFSGDWFRTPPEEEKRRFVYVQPIPVTDLRSNRSLLRPFFGALASALAGLTYPKAEHDHLRLEQIEEINAQVAKREELIGLVGPSSPEARHLREVLPYRTVSLDPIDPVLTFRSPSFRTLLLELAAEVRRELDAAQGDRDDGSQAPLLAGREPPADDAEALVRFETLLGVRRPGDKRPSSPLSPAELLASDLLGAFGGFFDERYRRHDYLIGRLSGLAWLLEKGPRREPALLQPAAIRKELKDLVQQAVTAYLPERKRRTLPRKHWLRVLPLLAVRLPYVLVSDLLSSRETTYRPLPSGLRRLLRLVIAPLLGVLVLVLVPPLLALVAVLVWLLGGLLRL